MVAFHAAENAYFLRKKEPLFSISDTEPQIPTSYNQQEAGTKEERSVLLNNNRWICLLPFAPNPIHAA